MFQTILTFVLVCFFGNESSLTTLMKYILNQDVSEGTGSNNKDENMVVEPVLTPTSKSLGKRGAEHVDSLDDIVLGEGDASTTKEPRIVSVKFEDID